jgi:prepilin-type N-terminal cleavage/methylation domain-containing protein
LRARLDKGYTLIELTVVMALIGLMLTISVPRFRYSLITDNMKSVARRLIGIIRDVRNEAIRERKAYFLHLDIESNRAWVVATGMGEEEGIMARERAFTFPRDVRIVDVWQSERGKQMSGEVAIRFSKKGYIEHTVIHLGAKDDREFTLVLSPFLGTVKSYDKYVDIFK